MKLLFMLLSLSVVFSCSKASFEVAQKKKDGAGQEDASQNDSGSSDAIGDKGNQSQGGDQSGDANPVGQNDSGDATGAVQGDGDAGQNGGDVSQNGDSPAQSGDENSTTIDIEMQNKDTKIITTDIKFEDFNDQTKKLNTLYNVELIANETNVDLKDVVIKVVASREGCDASSDPLNCLSDVIMDKVSVDLYQNKFSILVNRSISVYVVIEIAGYSDAIFRIESNSTVDVMNVNIRLLTADNCQQVQGYCVKSIE